MESNCDDCDFVVVGGGLGGILAALRFATEGKHVALIDNSLPAAAGRIGGFLRFSGAKFSLLPAGQGLIRAAGSEEKLLLTMHKALEILGIEHISSDKSRDVRQDFLGEDLELRSYRSIVLTPQEIDAVIVRLSDRLPASVRRISSRVEAVEQRHGKWLALNERGDLVAAARTMIYAGGRMGGHIVRRAGALPKEGKGLDVGVRVEFMDKAALAPLRELGPDAKILSGACRTFCLNSPGEIYRYAFGDASIPGGVVAHADAPSANVGLLCRSPLKSETLPRIQQRLTRLGRSAYETSDVVCGEPFQDKLSLMKDVFGTEISAELVSFARSLGKAGLIDWMSPHKVHFPLLDWHWDTYAEGDTHRTSLDRLFVVGDSSGHARGLLQAAASGWLAAGEALQK